MSALRQAVVLCGGRGTRLATALGGVPKVLVELGGEPLLLRLLRDLAAAGTREMLLLAGHRGSEIAAAVAGGAPDDLQVHVAIENTPRGTAGALHEVAGRLAERFLLVFADVFASLDWERLAAAGEARGGLATLVVHRSDHPDDSDTVWLDDDHRLAVWRRPGEAGAVLGNAGVGVLHRDILRRIPVERPSDLFRDVLPALVAERAGVYGYTTSEYVRDVGTPARLETVRGDLARGRPARRSDLVLLDRDGVLCDDVGLVYRSGQLRLLPGAARGLRRLNEAGVAVALVTNQPVVARGLCTDADLDRIHDELARLLAAEGAHLDSVHVCRHHPETHHCEGVAALRGPCRCHKPAPGLAEDALARHRVPAWRAVVIGDRSSDIQLARNAGLPGLLVETGAGGRDGRCPALPDGCFADFLAAARWLVP